MGVITGKVDEGDGDATEEPTDQACLPQRTHRRLTLLDPLDGAVGRRYGESTFGFCFWNYVTVTYTTGPVQAETASAASRSASSSKSTDTPRRGAMMSSIRP